MRPVAPKRRKALTLFELMVAMVLVAVASVAISYVFIGGMDMQRAHTARLAVQDRTAEMQRRLTALLKGALLTGTAQDNKTYFVGTTEQGNAGDLGCDRLTFTTVGLGIPLSAQMSEDDFETQQNARGPVGGVAEVSYGTTPVGNAGDRRGLFERMQRPSDGDPTQGGLETVLDESIDRMGFQFWDGLEWMPTWDTTTGTRRLPAAVKISYVLRNAPDSTVHAFIVPIPTSDVTAQNPVTNVGTSQ